MSGLRVLEKARSLIANERYWLQECVAQDAKLRERDPEEKAAIYFCAYGALRAARERLDLPDDDLRDAIQLLANEVDGVCAGDIMQFNDTSDHASVISAFDAAITRAKKHAKRMS